MTTFYDLMLEAQRGALQSLMTKEFGLTADQQAKAFEALMPAFWLGFRQQAADPFGIQALWQQMAGGQHKSYFENPFAAMSPGGQAEGNALLERMFGSKEVAHAVALQVEAATGIAQDVVRRMMPVMANVMAGGIERQAETFQNPFLAMMQGMPGMSGMSGAQGGGAASPFAAFMPDFFARTKSPDPEPGPPSGEEIIDRMFDAGRSMQNNYAKSMEQMFQSFSGGNGKKR